MRPIVHPRPRRGNPNFRPGPGFDREDKAPGHGHGGADQRPAVSSMSRQSSDIEAGSHIKRIKPDFDPRTYVLGKLSAFFDDYKDRYEASMSGTGKGTFRFKFISKTDARIVRQ